MLDHTCPPCTPSTSFWARSFIVGLGVSSMIFAMIQRSPATSAAYGRSLAGAPLARIGEQVSNIAGQNLMP
jgi:hypothetical protein